MSEMVALASTKIVSPDVFHPNPSGRSAPCMVSSLVTTTHFCSSPPQPQPERCAKNKQRYATRKHHCALPQLQRAQPARDDVACVTARPSAERAIRPDRNAGRGDEMRNHCGLLTNKSCAVPRTVVARWPLPAHGWPCPAITTWLWLL